MTGQFWTRDWLRGSVTLRRGRLGGGQCRILFVLNGLNNVCGFYVSRAPSEEAAPWRQSTVKKAKGGNDDDNIQWAGESHKRSTFRKTKDHIADWTNVLFRS